MKGHVWHRMLLTLIMGLVLTTSCAGVQMDIQGATRANSLAIGEENRGEEQIAIIGIDFDPPLDYAEATRMQGITMLVALENRGEERIEGARIKARLKTGEHTTKMLQRMGVLPDLPPHTVVVYRFPRLRNIPIRHTYVLDISVQSADGQQVLGHRLYKIRVKNTAK